MSGNEKAPMPAGLRLSARLSECRRRKRRSPIMKKLGQHSTKIGNACAKNA